MERSHQTLDPGASSSGGLREANQAEQPIQALRRVVDQVAHLHTSSSTWPTISLATIDAIIDNEYLQLMDAIATGGHYDSSTAKIITRIENSLPKEDMKHNDNMTKGAMHNLRRLLDSFSESDISKAYLYKNTQETHRIVANYLYRHNHFEVGDAFISEADVPETITMKSQYKKMHAILKALNEHDIFPAIQWIEENRGHPQLSGSRLKFNVYRQKYLQLLKESIGEPKGALDFMKKHLTTFGSDYLKEIKKLAGSMLWRDRLDESPYVDLLSSATWENLAKDFTEKFVAIAEQPPDR